MHTLQINIMNDNASYKLQIVFDIEQVSPEQLNVQANRVLHEYISEIELSVSLTEYKQPLLSIKGTLNVIDMCHSEIEKILIEKHKWSHFRILDEAGDEIRSRAYPILSSVEQGLRGFINRAIVEIFGFNWWVRLGQYAIDISDKIEEYVTQTHHILELSQLDNLLRFIEDEIPAFPEEVLTIENLKELLSEAKTIDELKHILDEKTRKYRIWDEVFSQYFPDAPKAWNDFKESLKIIIRIRHKVMHHRPVRLRELELLKEKVQIIHEVIDSAKDQLTVEEIEDAKEYESQIEEAFLQILQNENMLDKQFYDKAIPLDTLKVATQIADDEVQQVLDALNEPALYNYFFHNLDNPHWLKPLFEAGIFSKAPSKINVTEDSYYYPRWPASQYLSRIAAYDPQTVLEIIRIIETDNPSVIGDLINAASQLPTEHAIQLVTYIQKWFEAEEQVQSSFVNLLIELMNRFSSEGKYDAALSLFKTLTQPILPKPKIRVKYSFSEQPVSLIGDYWVEEVLLNALDKLYSQHSLEALYILKDHLRTASLHHHGGYSNWRSAIEDHGQDANNKSEYLHLLVSNIRNLMEEIAKIQPNTLIEFIRTDLQKSLSIFRRLAIHIIRLFPDEYPDAFAGLVSMTQFLDDWEVYHEYYLWLKQHYSRFNKEQQQNFLKEVMKLETPERWLRVIRSDLESEILDKYPDIEKFVESDTSSFRIYRGGVKKVVEASPVSGEELANYADEDLIQYLATFEGDYESGFDGKPSKVGLANELGNLVRNQPQRFLRIAPEFVELDSIYISRLINGIEQLVKEDANFDWSPLFELSIRMSAKSDVDEDVHAYALREVAGLIEDGIKKELISIKELPQAKNVLFALFDAKDSTWQYRDVVNASLNTAHGRALFALLTYALRHARIHFPKSDQVISSRLEPDVKEKLTELLDPEIEPSLAIRSVYGAFLPQLMYLDEEWCRENIRKIFPPGEKHKELWQAAWDGYMYFSRTVYDSIYELLKEDYDKAVNDLKEHDPDQTDENRALSEHIAILYLRGLEEYDSDLIQQFLLYSTDQNRAQLVWLFVSSIIGEEDYKEYWPRMLDYWKIRAKVFLNSTNPIEYNGEGNNFANLLEYVREVNAEIFGLVNAISKTFNRVWNGADDVLDFIQAHVEEFPEQASVVLLTLLESVKFNLRFKAEEIYSILQLILQTDNDSAKELAILFINKLGEIEIYQAGDKEFKDLIYSTDHK